MAKLFAFLVHGDRLSSTHSKEEHYKMRDPSFEERSELRPVVNEAANNLAAWDPPRAEWPVERPLSKNLDSPIGEPFVI